jgi:casein kinase II subunit beta
MITSARAQFFAEVPVEFIQDEFNLHDILHETALPYYKQALSVLVGPHTRVHVKSSGDEKAAETLYGLIHARYILSSQGLEAMRAKFLAGHFGQCPRVYCRGQNLIPVGQHDQPFQSTVRCFCAKCRDLYFPMSPKHRAVDGAAFGTSFPHMLLQTYVDLSPPKPNEEYTPRLFGFKLHASAKELRAHRGEGSHG